MKSLIDYQCINPKCRNTKVYSRGLCQFCYYSIARLISRNNGKYSWKQLEDAGIIKSTRIARKRKFVKEWLDKELRKAGK